MEEGGPAQEERRQREIDALGSQRKNYHAEIGSERLRQNTHRTSLGGRYDENVPKRV